MKMFFAVAVFLFCANSVLASMVYPSRDLAIISKEDLENARKYPNELRSRSKKITMDYLKNYNTEFKRLNKIEIDVVTKKFEDIVLLNIENMTSDQLLNDSQSLMLKTKDWLDFEANEIYTKYYLSSKKAYEVNLSKPSFNVSTNQAPVRYDSQISDLDSKIKELSDRFSLVLEKAESLENQNKVLKNEIDLSQKKIDSLQSNLDTARSTAAPTVAEVNKGRTVEYVLLGAVIAFVLGFVFKRRGKS